MRIGIEIIVIRIKIGIIRKGDCNCNNRNWNDKIGIEMIGIGLGIVEFGIRIIGLQI
jgi:hypothetical protein